MSDQENGLRQSPFTQGFATPDIGGTGLNGIGGGLDEPGGPNGISNSPYTSGLVPTPSGAASSDSLGAPYRDTIDIAGGSPKGTLLPQDITPKAPGNTIDKR